MLGQQVPLSSEPSTHPHTLAFCLCWLALNLRLPASASLLSARITCYDTISGFSGNLFVEKNFVICPVYSEV